MNKPLLLGLLETALGHDSTCSEDPCSVTGSSPNLGALGETSKDAALLLQGQDGSSALEFHIRTPNKGLLRALKGLLAYSVIQVAYHTRIQGRPIGICIYIYIYIHTHTDRQTDRQTNRQTDRHVCIHVYRCVFISYVYIFNSKYFWFQKPCPSLDTR